MLFRLFLCLCAILFGLQSSLTASEEETLPWTEVRIAGGETKATGKVVFSAKIAEGEYQEVTLEAFGKQFPVSQDDLEKLGVFPLNSLSITHEAGYEKTGGHMVHFKLKTAIVNQAGNLVESRVVLTISKEQGLTVSDPQRSITKTQN